MLGFLGNTQKLASKNWRYELYYWDYTIGILRAPLLVFTLGSFGDSGRGFLEDIRQVDARYIVSALIGGVIFNASNILLSASLHYRNGGCFSAGCRTCLGPRCVHQLFQHSPKESVLVVYRSNLDCYRYHLQWNSGRQTTKRGE